MQQKFFRKSKLHFVKHFKFRKPLRKNMLQIRKDRW